MLYLQSTYIFSVLSIPCGGRKAQPQLSLFCELESFRIGPHYKSGGAAVDLKLVFHFGWPIRSHLSVLVGSDQHVSKYGSKEDSTIIYHTSGYSRVNSR